MSSYHDELKALAEALGSDGCTHATQTYQVCCWEHDVAYSLSVTPRGVPTTKAQADRRFRDCLQAHSPFRFLSPLAGWRWLAVHWFGQFTAPAAPAFVRVPFAFMPADALHEAREARARMAEEDRYTHQRRLQ